VQIRIARDERVIPGGERWVELPGEVLLVVSAAGVTQGGAEALEDAWAWYIDRGLWRYGESGGEPFQTSYRRTRLAGRTAVRLVTWRGQVECMLDPGHFTQGTVNALQVCARSMAQRGWRYYAPAAWDSMAEAS